MNLAWSLFVLYLIGTAYLGWLGFKRTKNFSSFAIGTGDMSPFVVGITLAASTASAATFIINPGFIYVHGLSAFMHFVAAVGLGFCLMLVLLSFRFRRLGEENKALTMPHWIGARYQSKGIALYFATVNLFALAFVVLIVGGLSIVMQKLLGVSNAAALLIILGFVTGYVFLGGTYAHAFTNTLQGSLVLIVSLIIIFSGLTLFFQGSPGFFERIATQDSNLAAWVNPQSNLYNSVFSIYISGFIIGAALVCQPHILTKALYVKSDRAVRKYLLVAVIALVIFFMLPIAGFYARLTVPPEQLVDAATGAFRQDLVMTVYLKAAFPGWLFTSMSIVLLAAGMSTLDGILVALSTISANDLVLNLIDRFGKHKLSEDERFSLAYKLSHIVLVGIAAAAFLICLNPPKLLGIFGQVGVYGMAVAALPPILGGILFRRISLKLVWTTSCLGLAVHLVLYFYGADIFPNSNLAFANPGVTSTLAIMVSLFPVLASAWLLKKAEAKNNKDKDLA
ncbi:MAG: hypothetical protein ACE5IR_07490 [bacterium]